MCFLSHSVTTPGAYADVMVILALSAVFSTPQFFLRKAASHETGCRSGCTPEFPQDHHHVVYGQKSIGGPCRYKPLCTFVADMRQLWRLIPRWRTGTRSRQRSRSQRQRRGHWVAIEQSEMHQRRHRTCERRRPTTSTMTLEAVTTVNDVSRAGGRFMSFEKAQNSFCRLRL